MMSERQIERFITWLHEQALIAREQREQHNLYRVEYEGHASYAYDRVAKELTKALKGQTK